MVIKTMTLDELDKVYRWMQKYPSVHEWGWMDGALSQKQALASPGFG